MTNIVLLTPQEEFLSFLHPDYTEAVEVNESSTHRRLEVKYFTKDIQKANELFRQGNKLYVQGDGNLETGLYVINTDVEKDLYQENTVTFNAEDVLVELNFAPLFKQTDITTAHGFDIHVTNGENNVTVDYNALTFWFGAYYDIGLVQSASTVLANRVTPRGTMTLMELLRFIESETGNVFRTRYEKDPRSNRILRYLDYVNPNETDKSWTFHQDFYLPTASTDTPDPEDDDTEILFIPKKRYIPDLDNIVLRFVKDDKVLSIGNSKLSFPARDIGFDETNTVNQLKITYADTGTLTIQVNNITFTATSQTITSLEPTGTYTTIAGDPTTKNIIIPNGTIIELYDPVENETLIHHKIDPQLGNIHTQILDLGYNVENITIETDETDAFTAISPVIDLDTKEYTPEMVNNVINAWQNLQVTKGTLIPMVVERTKLSTQPTIDVPSNYYNLPQRPQDDLDNNLYDYFVATRYWYAPFTKNQGELHVENPSDTDLNYTKVFDKPTILNDITDGHSPRTGITETNDEDKYNIYNQVCNYLREHDAPKVEIKTEVAELNKRGEFNNFHLHDRVYLKIPNYDHLIPARVTQTSKNSSNIAENTIELDNYTLKPVVPLMDALIIGDNLEFDYPDGETLELLLEDANENPITNELISVTLYNNQGPVGIANNIFTNNEGKISIPYYLDPGEYTIECYYPGSEYCNPTSSTFTASVGGYKETADTSSNSGTNNNKPCWSKYGRSPDKKYICAIGKPDHNKDKGSGYKETILDNKCPYCGKKKLGYSIFYGKKETSTSGKHPVDKKNHGHANKGLIVCKKCGKTFSPQGYAHVNSNVKRINVVKNPKDSSKAKARELIQGKKVFKLKIKKNKKKKNTKKKTTTPTMLTSHSKFIKETAKKLVGNRGHLEALKNIAKHMGNIKYDYYTDFHRSPDTVEKMKSGNCCDQARLFLALCDAGGLTQWYTLEYIYVCCGYFHGRRVGHVFTKVTTKSTGTSRYVDPTCNYAGPYNHYNHNFGTPYSKKTTYPTRPF